ncbi:MAG: aldo/keto reductase [Cyclobacteriaceae bacterium]|nr:aldo/keto reductase [Cyclobacteriaceae bacterium HetDA_MAG_MS6]
MVSKIAFAQDLSLSQIVYGWMNTNQWELSNKGLLERIQYCLDLGITTMDHADIYGSYTCESLFGDAIALDPSVRDQMEIITKCGIALISDNRPDHNLKHYNTSYEHIIQSVETSLKNLRTDRIDLLLIHRPDPYNDPSETARAFDQLKKDGKALHFGVSNFSVQDFKTLQSYLDYPLVTNQLEISITCLDAFDSGNVAFAQEKRMKLMAWSPLAGGSIFTSTDDQSTRLRALLRKIGEETGTQEMDKLMLAWLLGHPSGIVPVIGTGNPQRIINASEATEVKLSRQQWFDIWSTSRGHRVP